MAETVKFFEGAVFSVAMPVALLLSGFFLLIKLRFFPFTHPVKTVKSAGGKGIFGEKVRALVLALGGTLGVGNIAGVSLAVIYGGEGSVFWLCISALIVMIIKYAEVVLAVRYRRKTPHGYEGGAVYYIENGLGMKKTACVFGFLCLLSSFVIGSMIQANAISDSANSAGGISPYIIGAVLFFAVIFVSVGGRKRVGRVVEAIIPAMSVVYVLMSLAVIIVNAGVLPSVFCRIIRSAFNVKSALLGGGAGMINAMKYGIMRGIFSNEAGVGTAPMAHATSGTSTPAEQGVMGIFEVVADTLIICPLTALVILLTNSEIPSGISAMQLVIDSFGTVFGKYAGSLIFISVFFFALATIVLWIYYGQVCLRYFTDSVTASVIFTVIYALSAYVGAVMSEGAVWFISDVVTSAMTFINLYAVLSLWHEVREETEKQGFIKVKNP